MGGRDANKRYWLTMLGDDTGGGGGDNDDHDDVAAKRTVLCVC